MKIEPQIRAASAQISVFLRLSAADVFNKKKFSS
jgi:hypothetical protein